MFALLVWFIRHIFVILLLCIFSYNICLEILINLRIYLVFMQISLCILWNPWISVVNLQYFNLKSIKISQFLNLFLTSLSSCILGFRLERRCHLKNYQIRSILNSKFVLNYSIFCNICSEILHVLRISLNILSDFTSDIVKSVDF